MKTSAACLISLTCLVALLTACGEVEDTRPGQPVKTRQVAFKEIIKVFEPMGVMLREHHYDADSFEQFALKLTEKKDAPWSHFGPDTNYPPTKATAEVWAQPALFEQEHQRFIKATEAVVVAAKTKDLDKVTTAYKTLHETCKSCHKTFKVR